MHRSWDLASGRPGSKHCSALNCVYCFRSIHHGNQFLGFRILPLGMRRTHTAQLTVYAISGILVSWDLDFCLWVPGDQTLLGIELICSCRVNSLQGSVDGIRDFASGCPGSTHCSALNCEYSFQVNSLQGLVRGIQDFAICYGNAAVTMDIASGRQGSTQCSVLNCICSRA